MNIACSTTKAHWNYFLALERDLEVATRYVEFVEENMSTYSIEFAHLLFAAASEVDVIAKLLCKHFAQDLPRRNMDDYRSALSTQLPELATMKVQIPRYGLTATPWGSWTDGQNPDWWRCYNKVKHERDSYFREATLRNAINALAGLMTLAFYHYGRSHVQDRLVKYKKAVTRDLLPESSLLRFPDGYYHDHLIV